MNWSTKQLILFIFTHSLPVLVVWTILTSPLVDTVTLWMGIVGLIIALLFSVGLYFLFTKPLMDIYSQVSRIAGGDLTFQSTKQLPGIFGKTKKKLNAIANKLQEFVTRTQAETEVIVSEANRLRMILNSINDGVFAIDRNKQIILFNKAAGNITGLKIEDVAGKHMNDVLPLTQNKLLAISQWVDECSDTDIQQRRWENISFTNHAGEELSLTVDALYTGADPNGVRALITFHNRTEEQQIEDMKVDFVALAAHELRTPVTVIKGYLEILESEIGDSLKPEHQEFLRKLDISATQLAGSINNILHVSHIEHGELSLHLEATSWSEIVTPVAEELAKKADAQGKKIEVEIASTLPLVAVDRVSITEVLTNLIDNALKYSETGKKIIVRATTDKTAAAVTTEVIDQGVGIPPSAIGKLFTKFYRSHRTRTSHRGTGLGLYMSKAIVEAHGGRIWVESKEDEGSTFGFELPTVENKDFESDNSNITRGVHGWIKNHSLYRG